MAVKYACDKCGTIYDTEAKLGHIWFRPPEGHNLYTHEYECGKEICKRVDGFDHILCDKCASDFLSQYIGKPVDANKRG